MTTLICVVNSEGVVGRCDAKCYDAQSAECDCICGGRNHGAGLAQARENVTELCRADLERWAREHGLEADALELMAQCDLFPYG